MPRSTIQNEQVRAESRQKILDTARRLFAAHGYDGCNVSTIAQESGMSQGNIYWYFASKEALFKAVLADGFAALTTMMATAAAQPGSSSEKFDDLLAGFLALSREQGGDEFITIVMTVLGRGGTAGLAQLGFDPARIGTTLHQSVSAILAQGQTEGSIAPDVEPNLLTTFFFAFLNGLMLMYPQEWKAIPPEMIRAALLRLLGMVHK